LPRLREILPGLHRWTADVPDWTPDQAGPEGWAREVACVAWEGQGALVLVDPLVADGDWGEIDALAERSEGLVAVVTTCPWHARSSGEALERYVNSAGATAWAHVTAAEDRERITFQVDHTVTDAAELPGGVSAFVTDAPQGEITLYIEPIRAVIAGDVLIGAEGERETRLRVCPQPWLDPLNSVDSVKAALRPLLEREIDAIVPLHGAPVLTGAKEALRAALG
jgi:hypothetical protein